MSRQSSWKALTASRRALSLIKCGPCWPLRDIFSRPIVQIHLLVWDVISRSVASPAHFEASESHWPARVFPGHWPRPACQGVRRAAASRRRSRLATISESVGRPLPASFRPERIRAAGAGQRPASACRGPGGWRSQPAPHGPFLVPAVSTTCWLTGR